ncbi:hypothetical protein RCH09_000793 [Actimicrobium sp. GrIS 1.19]|nr:hypothetical protein [Actimicrobium sp. GrIS 1.19]
MSSRAGAGMGGSGFRYNGITTIYSVKETFVIYMEQE